MIARALAAYPHPTADSALGWLAVGACGMGAVTAFAGAAAGSLPVAAIGGSLLAAGLAVALAARIVEPLQMLVVALPLPPLFSSDDLRISAALLVTILIIVASIMRAPAEPARQSLRGVLPWGTLAALLATVIAAGAVSAYRLAAARELFNWLLFVGLLFVVARELLLRPSQRHVLAMTIAALGAVCGVLALLQLTGMLPGRFPIPGTSLHRATLGFGWPNELGMFLALALPFAAYAVTTATTRAARVIAVCGAVAVGIGLIATFSRASWLAVLLAPLVLLVAGGGRVALRVWAVALAVLFIVDVASGGAIQARILSTIGDWVVEQRAALMLAGLLMFLDNPLTGVGPGGFEPALDHYGAQLSWLWDYLPTAQNGYVQMAAETGAIGLAALLLFLGTVLRRLLRSARSARQGADAALRRTVLWSFTTAVLLAFNEWIFAHGIAQLIVLVVALGLTLPAAAEAS
jgi:O-antigen ligase